MAIACSLRLEKKLELLDGYAKVMNMIEIEVEMDIQVPEAELAGIEVQMERLKELEGLQDDARVQAEARDEVSVRGAGATTIYDAKAANGVAGGEAVEGSLMTHLTHLSLCLTVSL